jgi:hypothetical protein
MDDVRISLQKVIGPTIEKLVDDIAAVLSNGLMEMAKVKPAPGYTKIEVHSVEKKRPDKPAGKKPTARLPLTDEQMRCKFTDKHGNRCKTRSRGPRYHFLCAYHSKPEDKPVAKKTSKKKK